MSKKKKNKLKVSFIGNNSCDVTGSMILIELEDKNILLECGMVQSQNSILDYKTNAKAFPFKPKNIDYVFINHTHTDHMGLSPKLVRDGFQGRIITTPITASLMKPMLLDSSNIIRRDAVSISKKRGIEIEPFYNDDDVYNTLDIIDTYEYNQVIQLDENISFKFLHNSHIIGAAQLELYIKDKSGYVSKILYTSDLGSFKTDNYYVDNTEKCMKANVVISESTYGSKEKDHKINRKKDLEKIKTVVNQVCIQDKGRILIPVFSLARCQQILTDLYMLYKDDKDFNIPIVVDSPLIWEVTKVYKEVLQGENKELFEKVCNWENVRFIKDYNESKISVQDKSPKICLSSSGFLHKGRSLLYLQEYIHHAKDAILFVGYAPEGSIAGRIKSGQKSITIEGKTYKNRCGITILNSYSSHIQRQELIDYLKGIATERIYLVHGDMDGKVQLKEDLEQEMSNMCKTTHIIATNKSTSFNL